MQSPSPGTKWTGLELDVEKTRSLWMKDRATLDWAKLDWAPLPRLDNSSRATPLRVVFEVSMSTASLAEDITTRCPSKARASANKRHAPVNVIQAVRFD